MSRRQDRFTSGKLALQQSALHQMGRSNRTLRYTGSQRRDRHFIHYVPSFTTSAPETQHQQDQFGEVSGL
eukprot:CAMPEP_0198735202 /NCGR_PEP_ID=MMETSP1475-20131203/57898_1 /TAXON_ID= ORGANISM="Unidentified sp., Strain CCMP1999" /NCGR_SAMPLE_ID=MMETSP1475 /ASSEMBLY_ACC=CAM_ASM_001111 /LENGTH=69 /DNA_ID=CAMNT_0044498815 /DNA_START=159 /DNA_END=368 /DNA_ORIENTATION=+